MYRRACTLLILVLLTGISLTPVASGSEGIVVRELQYNGLLVLTATGRYAEGVIPGLNYISIEVKYTVSGEVSLDAATLKPLTCSLHVNVTSVSTSQVSQNIPVEQFSSWNTSINLSGDECTTPPIALSVKNASIILEPLVKKGVVVGVTRLDVDAIHIVGGEPYPSPSRFNSSIWSAYFEPLTGIIVHYTYTYTERMSDSSYSYSLTLILSNYMRIFEGLTDRLVLELKVANTTDNPSLIIIYSSLGSTKPPVSVSNVSASSLLLSFSEPTACYLVAGPFNPNITLNSNIKLETYSTLEGLYVYYSRNPSLCSNVWLNFTSQMTSGSKGWDEEKGVPPRLNAPSLGSLVFTLSLLSMILYVAYSIAHWIVKKLLKPAYAA